VEVQGERDSVGGMFRELEIQDISKNNAEGATSSIHSKRAPLKKISEIT
jgi:hypothetical protein